MSAEPLPRLPGEATWKSVKACIAKNNEATHSCAPGGVKCSRLRGREAMLGRRARGTASTGRRSCGSLRCGGLTLGRGAAFRRPLEAVTQRLDRLEAMIQGLQDAVDREAQREDRQIEDVRDRTRPGRMVKALSDDARHAACDGAAGSAARSGRS